MIGKTNALSGGGGGGEENFVKYHIEQVITGDTCVLKFTKPQGNYVKDKLCHPSQKPRELLEHLVWLSDKDHDGYVIGDFFAGSGSLLRAVNEADVILCDKNDEYYDKFFDTYVTDERVYKCKKEYLKNS